jgi:hypothetical protein
MSFRDLRRRAENAYSEFIEVVEEKAEVTGDAMLEKRVDSLKEKAESEEKLYTDDDLESTTGSAGGG